MSYSPKPEAIIVSRPGDLDGEFGTPSFSTIQIFHHGSQVEVEVPMSRGDPETLRSSPRERANLRRRKEGAG